MKANLRKFIVTFFVISNALFVYSQDFKDYLSPQWDNHYNKYPSGIKNNFQASDFIKIIDLVEYSPVASYLNRDLNTLKKALLRLEFADLRQMSITGDFYSRSKKHDDYFQLYNLTYKKVSKETWDKYCPYLIPLMEIDSIIKLH